MFTFWRSLAWPATELTALLLTDRDQPHLSWAWPSWVGSEKNSEKLARRSSCARIVYNRSMRPGKTLCMLLLLASAFSFAQSPSLPTSPFANSKSKEFNRKLDEQIKQWLKEGEHTDIPWKVKLEKPRLTFQQRQFVRVSAEIDSRLLQQEVVQRELHFVLRVALEDGKWLDDGNYISQRFDEKLDANSSVQFLDDVLLQTGDYTIATIAYDAVRNQHNVAFNRLHVGSVTSDLFPDLLKNIDRVGFPEGVPLGLEAFGPGRIHLPVMSPQPLALDLIVDVSERPRYYSAIDANRPSRGRFGRRERGPLELSKTASDQGYVDRLLQSASVLSQLDLREGCVRVTVLDTLKQISIFQSKAGKQVDWPRLRDRILTPDRVTVSVKQLTSIKDAPKFFAQQMQQLLASTPQCSAGTPPSHVVAVVSHGIGFASGSAKPKIETSCDCPVYYFHQTDVQVDGDGLKGILSPLHPKRLDFKDPMQFRRTLADFVQDLQVKITSH